MHTFPHTHTQAHQDTFILPFLLFSILPLCKCVFCSSSATRSFIHEPARWRRDGLIYSQLTLHQPAGHAVCCVLCVAVCTRHLHLLRLFESNSLLRSYGDFLFIYSKYGFFAPLHFRAVFMLSLHYWSVKMKVRVESKKNGRRNQCYFPAFTIGDAEILYFLYRSVSTAWYTLSVCLHHLMFWNNPHHHKNRATALHYLCNKLI